MPENWVDIGILFLLALFALQGLQRGLVRGLLDVGAFALALLAALRWYPQATEFLEPYVGLPTSLLRPLAFLGLWLVVDVLASLLARALAGPLGRLSADSTADHVLGFLPGVLKGGVIAAFALAMLIALPLPEPVKDEIGQSALGSRLAAALPGLEGALHAVFGEAVLEGISFATVRPQSEERVPLRFTVADARIDEAAEARMLQLLNEERVRAGLKPLREDPSLAVPARAHARDMLAQGYFAHVNNEGKSPAQRALTTGVKFGVLGENLALAPTVDLAHRGLMDSPGHRANILSPQYGRVGIGVADGGLHGKMFAQEFAD